MPLSMRISVRLLYSLLILLFLHAPAQACIDSIWVKIESVQCFGMRNGTLKVNKVFGGQGPYYFSLDGLSFSTNPGFEHLWAGAYDLLIRDASGCIKTVPVVVPEPAEFAIRLQASDTVVIAGKPLLLQVFYTPETTAFKSIEWHPPHLFARQDTLRQTIAISQATNFAVEAVNQNGCASSSHLSVEIEQTHVYIPNAIKPGSAQDAFLTVYSGEGVSLVKQLAVFSRSGAKVFERQNFPPNDPFKGWNGRWEGEKVQPGVYVYLAEVEMLDGTFQHFEGTVTVVE